ncbi:MAG: methyltransferase domain-containing protein [Desulfuromonadia bacterium]
MSATEIIRQVREYYGKVLSTKSDLKTSACCSIESLPAHHRRALANIDDEILDKFYGCGSPIPAAIEGCRVLDLGCGTGRDVYLASQLVGPDGFVIGVDMTDEQLEVARRHKERQMARFGYRKANVDFRQGYIEDLAACGIEDDSIDVIISNCVINLSPDKGRVFSEIFRVLKPGGELYFSDVFSGRRMPEELKHDPVLYGECLSGAMYIEDFRRMLAKLGCQDYRTISSRQIELNNPEVEAKAGMIDFYSITIRAFKLPSLEDICEDYGQSAVYLGTIPEYPHRFPLDDRHIFITGKPMLVCGNTAAMLQETRLGRHFRVSGDRTVHFGPFECGSSADKQAVCDPCSGGACC